MKMIKRSKWIILYYKGESKMSRSTLFITTSSISLALVVLVIISGCTTTPSGPAATPTATSLPSTTEFLTTLPTPASTAGASGSDIQLRSNIYGLATNPHSGIDTIYFSIGLPSQVPDVNLTGMKVVFTAPGAAPVILIRGTKDSTSTFTTTQGNNLVTSLGSGDEVEITFRVNEVPAGAKVQIDVKPQDGAVLPVSRTVPAMLSSVNILD